MAGREDSLHDFFDDDDVFNGVIKDGDILTEATTVITVIVPRDEPHSDSSELEYQGNTSDDEYSNVLVQECLDIQDEFAVSPPLGSVDGRSSKSTDSAMRDLVIIEMEDANARPDTPPDDEDYDFENPPHKNSSSRNMDYGAESVEQRDGSTPQSNASYASTQSCYSRYSDSRSGEEYEAGEKEEEEDDDDCTSEEDEGEDSEENNGDIGEALEPEYEYTVTEGMNHRAQRIARSSVPYLSSQRLAHLEKTCSADQNDHEQTNTKQKSVFRHQAQAWETDNVSLDDSTGHQLIGDRNMNGELPPEKNHETTNDAATQKVADKRKSEVAETTVAVTVRLPTQIKAEENKSIHSRIPVPKDKHPYNLNKRPVLPAIRNVEGCNGGIPNTLLPVSDVIPQPIVNLHIPRPENHAGNLRHRPKLKPDIPHQMHAAACYHDGKMAVSIVGDQSLIHNQRDPLNVSITFINKQPAPVSARSAKQTTENRQQTAPSKRGINIFEQSRRMNKGKQLPSLKYKLIKPITSCSNRNGYKFNTGFKQWHGHQIKWKRANESRDRKERVPTGKMNRQIVEQRAMLPPFNTHTNPEASARHQKYFG